MTPSRVRTVPVVSTPRAVLEAVYENERVYRVLDSRLDGMSIEQVGDYIGPDGELRILIRAPSLLRGDRVVTTQLPRAITGLLVAPVDAESFDETLADSG